MTHEEDRTRLVVETTRHRGAVQVDLLVGQRCLPLAHVALRVDADSHQALSQDAAASLHDGCLVTDHQGRAVVSTSERSSEVVLHLPERVRFDERRHGVAPIVVDDVRDVGVVPVLYQLESSPCVSPEPAATGRWQRGESRSSSSPPPAGRAASVTPAPERDRREIVDRAIGAIVGRRDATPSEIVELLPAVYADDDAPAVTTDELRSGGLARLARSVRRSLDHLMPLVDRLRPIAVLEDPEPGDVARRLFLTAARQLRDEIAAPGGPQGERVASLLSTLREQLGDIQDAYGLDRHHVVTTDDDAVLSDYLAVSEELEVVEITWERWQGNPDAGLPQHLHRSGQRVDRLASELAGLLVALDDAGLDEATRRTSEIRGRSLSADLRWISDSITYWRQQLDVGGTRGLGAVQREAGELAPVAERLRDGLGELEPDRPELVEAADDVVVALWSIAGQGGS